MRLDGESQRRQAREYAELVTEPRRPIEQLTLTTRDYPVETIATAKSSHDGWWPMDVLMRKTERQVMLELDSFCARHDGVRISYPVWEQWPQIYYVEDGCHMHRMKIRWCWSAQARAVVNVDPQDRDVIENTHWPKDIPMIRVAVPTKFPFRAEEAA